MKTIYWLLLNTVASLVISKSIANEILASKEEFLKIFGEE